MSRATLGKKGEEIAAIYLKRRGYRVLERNWDTRGRTSGKLLGEIDIVARKGDNIVFVEVKAGRGRDPAYRPELRVAHEKARRFQRACRVWLAKKRMLSAPWQIDVIAVDFPEDATPRVRHIERAIMERR